MQNHVKNYFEAYGYGEQDIILCERCKAVAVDIHHIVYRSEAPNHELLDHPVNLIAVCRSCHEYYHSDKSNRQELADNRQLAIIFDKTKK